MSKYLVGTKSYDSENGYLHGVYDIVLVDTMEEAVLEQQKRLDVRVIRRNRPNTRYPKYSAEWEAKYGVSKHDQWASYDNHYPGNGVEVSVSNETGIFEIVDNKVDIPNEDSSNSSTEYGSFVICTPVYELDPRGTAYNHKIIQYLFEKEEKVSEDDEI